MGRHGKGQAMLLATLMLLHPLGAGTNLRVGMDVVSLYTLFTSTIGVRLEADLSLSDEFGLRVPVSVDVERMIGGPYYLEGAVFLDYHPMGWPLCISLSLAQLGILGNHPWEDGASLLLLNEMAIAWDLVASGGLYIRPQVVIRDPNRVFEAEYEELSDFFTRFAMVRFSLVVGWSFPVGSSERGRSE